MPLRNDWIDSGATDAGPSQTVTRTSFTSEDCSSTPVDLTTAPGTGLKAVAMDIIVTTDTACELKINTESGSQLLSAFLPAACGFVQLTPRGYIKAATAAKKLQITTSVAAKVRGLCIWFTEA